MEPSNTRPPASCTHLPVLATALLVWESVNFYVKGRFSALQQLNQVKLHNTLPNWLPSKQCQCDVL